MRIRRSGRSGSSSASARSAHSRAALGAGQHPAGVGDRLAVDDLGDAGVEPFGLQDDLRGEVGDAGEVGDLAEVVQHPGDRLLRGGVGDAGLGQAAEGAVGGDGQFGQLAEGAGGGVPGGGPAGAHQGQGGGVAGNGVAQLADAEPRAGVDGADRGDARVAVGQVVRERGRGVFVAVGGDQQDRGVGGAGGDGVEPGGDLPVGGAGAGVPDQQEQGAVGQVEALGGPVFQLPAEVPHVQVHRDSRPVRVGQRQGTDAHAVGLPLIGVERLAEQLLGQRGLAHRGLAHDQDLRAPALDGRLGQGPQERQHRLSALGLHLPRRTGQMPVAAEVEVGQGGELPDRVRDRGQLVAARGRGGSGR